MQKDILTPVAQWIAHLTSNQGVASSSLARSDLLPASVAQLVEHWSYEPKVTGSKPVGSTLFPSYLPSFYARVTQSAERGTFNAVVEGSSPFAGVVVCCVHWFCVLCPPPFFLPLLTLLTLSSY